eukprot:SAG31_NODE_4135_length_3550_cov_2.327731_2_plen_493_part_00
MWAAKLPTECSRLWDAAIAMKEVMLALGVAVQGGKDSLSMAAKADGDGIVKAPGTLTISAYGPCPDVSKTVTPDFKEAGSAILFVDLGKPGCPGRLGGSSFAQAMGVNGQGESPDLDSPELVRNAWNGMQALIEKRGLKAGHDRSDGGLVVALIEMAISGGLGFEIDLASLSMVRYTANAARRLPCTSQCFCPQGATDDPIPYLFGEDLGLVLEVDMNEASEVCASFRALGVPCYTLGKTLATDTCKIICSTSESGESDPKKQKIDSGSGAAEGAATVLLDAKWTELSVVWEATSFELEKMQCDADCVAQEQAGVTAREKPQWKLSYVPQPTKAYSSNVKVAILRTEGSNGDREMAASFHLAGFEAWDVTVSDLVRALTHVFTDAECCLMLKFQQFVVQKAAGKVSLDQFRGMAMVGGFSYADTLDSAKGWAASAKFHPEVRPSARSDFLIRVFSRCASQILFCTMYRSEHSWQLFLPERIHFRWACATVAS